MSKLRMSPDLSLPLDAVTQKLAFIGRTGSGKTYAATKLAELFGEAGAQFIALDPVGKWWSLRLLDGGKPSGIDVPVFGGLHGDLPLEPLMGARIADLIVDRQISAVLDVSQFEHNTDKARFAEAFATRLFYRKKSAPSAVHLFVEEAQEFVPQNPHGEEKRMLGAFERLIKLGRNFGIGASLISQRPQEINKKALNQTECLFVFQTTGTHERKAIDAWIADKGIDEDIAALLPSLHVGEARVWSPAWLRVSMTTQIGEKRTFDASATPKVGARKVEVKALTPIDIAEITKSLSDVVERAKADDPRELKRRITELEKQLKAANLAQTTIVEKPVLTKKQVDDLAMVASKCDIAAAGLANVALDTRRILMAFDESQRRTVTPSRLDGKRIPTAPIAAGEPPPPRRQHQGSGEPLSSGQHRILLALAQYGTCSKTKLAILTRYAANGGGFNNNLGALRVSGRIVGADPLLITDVGYSALGSFDPRPNDADALFNEWVRHPELGKAHREIMRVLKEYGGAVSKEVIASRCDPPYEPGGGGFNNAISKLRTLGIIEGKTEINLSEQLRG